MHRLILILLLGYALGLWGQSSSSSSSPSSPASSQAPEAASSSASKNTQTAVNPRLAPPRSDRVDARALDDGESSSKDTKVDLSPPEDDAKAHPRSAEVLADEGSGAGDVAEVHPWNPHKAAKDIEVGDFYFKRKNYKAAEDRYREALLYKDNDAIATFRLAVCLEKLERPDNARAEYESYLKILPYGPEAENAKKAIDRLKGSAADTKLAK